MVTYSAKHSYISETPEMDNTEERLGSSKNPQRLHAMPLLKYKVKI